MQSEREHPVYHGMTKHADKQGGYALWLPSDWHRFALTDGHEGMLFSPYADRTDTHMAVTKMQLPVAVDAQDVADIRDGFEAGLNSLPGVNVESQDETITSTLIILEARFTYLEGETRRKRWTRVVYWGDRQLLLVAQGATVDEFEYWLPMLFNTMMSVEIT